MQSRGEGRCVREQQWVLSACRLGGLSRGGTPSLEKQQPGIKHLPSVVSGSISFQSLALHYSQQGLPSSLNTDVRCSFPCDLLNSSRP